MEDQVELPVKYFIELFIRVNKAESGPPLGTVLGNLGLNSVKFCKEFNEFTKDLPYYFVIKTRVLVYENRTYSFFISEPSTSYLLNCLKIKKVLKKKSISNFKIGFFCIDLIDLIKVARFKLCYLPLKNTLFMV
jgi:large subunit ribosomal protein L11